APPCHATWAMKECRAMASFPNGSELPTTATAPRKIEREKAFGQNYTQSVPDKVGIWLSGYRIRRWIPTFEGKAVGDFGCGYEATFARSVARDARSLTLVDVTLADDLKADPKVTAIEGILPDAMQAIPARSLDIALCINVLEHLWDPAAVLREFRRILVPGGVAFLNVPSWRGKVLLEALAFKLNMTPKEEIDDHKAYYTPRDLWKLVVSSGFKPSNVVCRSHKLGLNTFAVCTNT